MSQGWGKSHTWMRQVTHAYLCVWGKSYILSHTWMRQVTTLSHPWMRYVTQVNEAIYEWGKDEANDTYEWGKSHILIHACEASHAHCHTHEWGKFLTWMRLYMNESRMRQVTHMNEASHKFLFMRVRQVPHIVTHMNEASHAHWHTHEWGKLRVNEAKHEYGKDEASHTYEWGKSNILIHACGAGPTHLNERGTSHIWMRQVTHMNESWHMYE